MHFIGIDIGSTSSKVAVMDERGEFCELFLLPSGFSAVKVARQIKQALEQKGYAEGFVTATGYGRVSVEYAQLSMSEILCHGLGAHFLFEQDCTVIDVGGQDTKAIKIENGKPVDFIMNDKYSAGTGKFLEISAGRLRLELSEIRKTARKNPTIKLSPYARYLPRPSSLSANKGRSGRKYRAERYLKIPCSVMYQNDARSDIIKEFIREYQAHGVIDVVDCHTYATLTNRIKEASREAGANYMSLETDYSKQDVGQIRTRLEAFIELL